MKENFIHVCFVVDESGSMYQSKSDVIGGFQKVIDEQKARTEGKCAISLYTFNGEVTQRYLGKDVSEVTGIDYNPGGCTAMNDGICTAIKEIGDWLRDMPESERPEQNLIIIMTDGEENSSKEYTLADAKEMIKHQTEKYSWKFMYIGTDITTTRDADNLGIKTMSFSTRNNYYKNYDTINAAVTSYRCCAGSSLQKAATMDSCLDTYSASITNETEKAIGKKITKDSQ